MAALQFRQIAMDQPRRGRGSARTEIALLQQDDPQAAPGGVARNADAVQPAADDRKIVVRHTQRLPERAEFTTPEHDPERWAQVFPRDKRKAFALSSCATKG